MIDYIFIKTIISQRYVDINIRAVFLVAWDFITVDRGKLVSVLIIFIDNNGILLRIRILVASAPVIVTSTVFLKK